MQFLTWCPSIALAENRSQSLVEKDLLDTVYSNLYMKRHQYGIGIDEAGRGPLAGPVAVGAALVPADFDWRLLPGVGDSKKVTPKRRLVIYAEAKRLQSLGLLEYVVVMKSAKEIDKKGIVPCIKEALVETLHYLGETKLATSTVSGDFRKQVLVKLDGGLVAPPEYMNQETIIKGDAKELVIGLASIMAKVTRDQYMEKLAKKAAYSLYGFAIHKGYGTRMHRELIKQHGLSKEHRQSFCRSIK